MHRNHGIDRGTEVTEGSGAWGGYPVWPGVPPPRKKAYIFFWHISVHLDLFRNFSGKVTTYFQHNCTALIFGIRFGVFPIGTARRPIQLQSATRRPDCGLSE